TLALGIGANTAIFSVVNALMLRNLPVRNPGRLVLFSDNPGETMGMGTGIPSGRQRTFSYPFYEDVRDHSQFFQGICAFQTSEDTLAVRAANAAGGSAQVAQGKMVSGNFFSVLGVKAALGRTFTPQDDQPGAAPVAMVSFNFWQNKLGGDPALVGRTVDIDSLPVTLVGVTPRGFFGVRMSADPPDFWMPLSLRPRLPLTVMPQAKSLLTDPNAFWLNLMGRLRPGAGLAAAGAEINGELRQYLTGRLGSRITASDRQQIQHSYINLVPGGRGLSELRYHYSTPLRILLAIVGLVLLIACANVANLMLARATARRREMAVRLAMGATRRRLIRQVLVESALLALAGGAAGALLAFWGAGILVAQVAAKAPLNTKPDLAVLGFTVGVSLLAVIFSGLAPALRSARVELVPALKEGSSSAEGKRKLFELGKGLVVFQIAASLLLLIGAGLLVHSLVALENQDLGFNPQHVLLVHLDPEIAGYRSKELPALYRQLVDRVRALPGVRSASIGMQSPMSGGEAAFDISLEGQPPSHRRQVPQVVAVGPDYFETEGMHIIEGRAISAQDTATSTPVAVVNQAFVHKFLPRGNPIGHRFSSGDAFKPPGFQIVGVLEDVRYSSTREPAGPMVFFSAFQLQAGSILAYVNEIEVRTAGDPARITGEVRGAIHDIDSNLPITDITTLATQVDDSLGQQRAVSGLTGFFGILGLLLACVGLYGIMAYSVARKTHDIGIRMALGAERRDVLRLVIGQGLKLALIGVAIGIAGALGLTRFLSSLLYGVKPTDPITFVAVSLILIAVALAACYIPARRATKVDPMEALRYE
ncbi:MAG: ABC transporter permease, partial [Acidobacteriota bacterium]